MPPVEEKSPVGGELRRAESEPLRNALNNIAAGYYLGNQRVQLRGLDIPERRGINAQVLRCYGIACSVHPDGLRNAGGISGAGVRLSESGGVSVRVKHGLTEPCSCYRSPRRAQYLGGHGYCPILAVLFRGNVHAIVSEARFGRFAQPHAAIDSRAGIPAGIRRTVVDADSYRIFAVHDEVGYIKLERGISVLPLAGGLSVDVHVRIHVHAVKSYVSAHSGLLFIAEAFPIPARGGLIQIISVVNQPIVREVNRPEIKAVGIFGAKRRLEKFPAAAKQPAVIVGIAKIHQCFSLVLMGSSKNRFEKGKWVEYAECDESLLVRLYALRGGATRCCRAK
ncbi:unknown [Eubacterium sp. CAG:115]|nr:unknown [Eubacterium sp. CAG:115]